MGRQGYFPQRIEGVRTPALASDDTLALCKSERDALLVSITLSGLTYEEIASRIGVTKQAVSKWTRKGIPHERVRAFCNATGSRLVEQFIRWQLAKRQMTQQMREADRIAAIVETARAAA
jgi:phage terminase Nu1 subunit (DNA packaging protein)